jgi:hypothetical protein
MHLTRIWKDSILLVRCGACAGSPKSAKATGFVPILGSVRPSGGGSAGGFRKQLPKIRKGYRLAGKRTAAPMVSGGTGGTKWSVRV